ncbi:T9SS type B sorting domain-containing protein, partial [Flavobacterium sp. LC2016-12]|uniref:T9SS type B sorting domain-containing protein n=1 Tax=Flavobacterium sp. LC2016-12 TaxID=2783794 RepID=UPI00188B4647
SNDGCTADQVLNLTVGTKPSDVVTTKSICAGDSYKWIDNVTYTTSQNGIRISNDGCTADQVLNLTVGTKPSDVVTTQSICAGESYTWIDNVTYTTSQNGIRISNDGCTADQVLNLTVGTKPLDVVTTKSICSGDSYTWPVNGIIYSVPQIGVRISNDGCTADQVLNLTVGTKPSDVVTTESICAGESYKWIDNVTYTTSQNGIRISNDGCTADQVLNLIVGTKPSDVVTTKSICAGQTYTWPANGIIYSVSQTELRISNDGCTADQVLNLIVALPLRASVITNSVLPELCTGENNGSFSIEISGGIAPYKVSLNQSDGVYGQVIGMEHSFSNISASKQIVYIKDALDCTFELQVNMPESIILNPVATVNYGCSVNSVKISVDVSTNLNDIDYALDNGSYQKDNLFTNLSAGLHTIAARHTNGCSKSTKPFIIKHFEPLELSLTTGELNEIVASATGGGGEYQYSFEDQSFSKDDKFIIYKSGNYKVSVIDKNGCSTTVTQYFAYIDVCIPNYFTPNGDGVNDEWGPDCTVNYKNLTYTIIDRYGREIANYHYGQKWDGKYNGKELTSGDYWYIIKLNDPKDHREFVGHFTLYR